MKKIKVLIIEDSKLMQEILTKILSQQPEIQVIGVAADPLVARDLIKRNNPDVVTLDIMLPFMDGITFLKNMMRLHPLPVVMISTLTAKSNDIAIEALAIGAVECVPKPSKDKMNDLSQFEQAVVTAVKTAATANVTKAFTLADDHEEKLHHALESIDLLTDKVIAIGASTGGIEAIESILLQLPSVLPPILIVQHIKKEFNQSFSNRIRKLYGLSVIEPTNNLKILPGNIYISPADTNMTLIKLGKDFVLVLNDNDTKSSHKPSVDALFHSVAHCVGNHAIGVLLTGMGSDGAEGLKAIKDAGGMTIAQDKESSVVWGMPGSAVKLNAVDHVVPLNSIPQTILKLIDTMTLGVES